MDHGVIEPNDMPVRTKMWARDEYDGIDEGIRFAVKVLHAVGIETCQSCRGGSGHAYLEPTIEMMATADDAEGFAALAQLHHYGLGVHDISIIWKVSNGLPFEKLWRITFNRAMPERADDWPMFEWCYRAITHGEESK